MADFLRYIIKSAANTCDVWCQAFHGTPEPGLADEPDFLPGNDGFSYAFAQCEVEDHCGTSRRGGLVERTYHSLRSMESFRLVVAQLLTKLRVGIRAVQFS
jgi:hypothetical protein